MRYSRWPWWTILFLLIAFSGMIYALTGSWNEWQDCREHGGKMVEGVGKLVCVDQP